MFKRSSQILYAWFLVWDLVFTAVAWIGAYHLRFESGWIPLSKTQPDFYFCWRILPLVIVFAAFAYRLTGQYTLNRLRRFPEEMAGVIRGTALFCLLLMATT